MNSDQLAERVLDLVKDRAEAEVLASSGLSSLTRFANSSIHQNVGEYIDSVSLRLAVDGRIATGRTTRTSVASLEALVEDTLATALREPADEDWPGLTEPIAIDGQEHYDAATADASPVTRAEMVKAFVDEGEGLLGAGYCETEGGTHTFMNSLGHRVSGRETSAAIDGIHQTGSSAGTGHAFSVSIGDLDAASVGALAAKRARDSEQTFDAKPDAYEVVLAPEAAATIGVFLAVYGFNAKSFEEGMSFAEVGEQQFDEDFHLYDDASDERARGLIFDSEGTPKQRVDLVEDGKTKALAHNRRTAKKAGVESTGNSFPGAEMFGPVPFNLFIDGGDKTQEELIGEVERGIYVSTFNYCRILDPKSMVVTGLTRNGTFMIENGEITGAVSNLRFTQSFVEALALGKVKGKGSDARFANSEFGAGFVHAPSLRLESWNFTGGADG